jgi:hypothetical protein
MYTKQSKLILMSILLIIIPMTIYADIEGKDFGEQFVYPDIGEVYVLTVTPISGFMLDSKYALVGDIDIKGIILCRVVVIFSYTEPSIYGIFKMSGKYIGTYADTGVPVFEAIEYRNID